MAKEGTPPGKPGRDVILSSALLAAAAAQTQARRRERPNDLMLTEWPGVFWGKLCHQLLMSARGPRKPTTPLPPPGDEPGSILLRQKPEMGDGDSLTFKWTAASGAVPAASTKRGRRYSLRGSIRYIMASVMTAMRATFLPVGYPDSVAPEYITFQVAPRRARVLAGVKISCL
ncbi:MAG: hypothetical protein P4L40_02190 [Terracidiphilus sp.]|nr:hypothetical protein [Terracidiphilus sp.]